MSQAQVTDYDDATLALALALANSTHTPAADGRGPDGSGWEPEGLRAPEDLAALLAQHGWQVPAAPTAADVGAARRLRDGLRAAFEAGAAGDEAGAAAALDRLLAGAAPRVRARLTPGGLRVELVADPGAPLAVRLATELPLAVARAAERSGAGRLRVCADAPAGGAGCRSVFVDTSRNGTRRFCHARCASRTHVAAFRARTSRERAADNGPDRPGAD